MRITVHLTMLAALLVPARSGAQPKAQLIETKKIWSEAPHNSHTDLMRYNGRWYCVCREGADEHSKDGIIRVLSSADGVKWESSAAIKSPDAPGDAHVGLVHSLVARMEGRLVVMLTTREDELRKGQRRLEAMIDWLVQLYLAHTPEVPEERRATAAAGVHRRYRNYRKAVADSVGKTESHGAEA